MTWVIGPLCIDKLDTACVGVCPVDCIHLYRGNDSKIPKNQLLIDPSECIDCAACEPACPWEAIYQDEAVPKEFKEFIELNALIQGQTEIEQTPHEEKPAPSPAGLQKTEKYGLPSMVRLHEELPGIGMTDAPRGQETGGGSPAPPLQ
jgi:ferredoxin